MSINKYSQKRVLFSRIFLLISTAVSVTIISVTLFFQVFYENAIVKLINTSIQNNLQQISYSASYMRDTALTNSKQIFFLKDVDKLLHFTSLSYLDYSKGLSSLNQLLATTPYIHSVYLYNGKSSLFCTDMSSNPIEKDSFMDTFAVSMVENTLLDRSFIPYTRKISVDINAPDSTYKTNVYTFIYYSNSKNPNILDSAVIINIKDSWIQNIIKNIQLDSNSEIIIVDENGTIVSSSDVNKMLQDISDKQYFHKLVSSQNKNDYFRAEIDGTNYLVSYITLNNVKWKFIQLTPYANIMSTYTGYKMFSLMVAAIILFLGIIMSKLISVRIYNPIHIIKEKLEDMEEKKRNLLFSQKQEYLNSILQGTFVYIERTTEESFVYFNLQIKKTGYYQLIILKIDNCKMFISDYNLADRNIILFGMMNISSEIISALSANECTCISSKYISIILNTDIEMQFTREQLTQKIEAIRNEIYLVFNIHVAAVATSKAEGLEKISSLYDEGIELHNYFVFKDSSHIIFYDSIPAKDISEYTYPLNDEEKMIEYLRMGNMEKAYEIYEKIVAGTLGYTFNVFNTTVFQLALTINSLAFSLARNGNHDIRFSFSSFIHVLDGLEKLEDINMLFKDTFGRIIERPESTDERNQKLVQTINRMIESNYHDPNFSIESISKSIMLSTVYLGQLYKKITSKSISETITEYRLEMARELLLNTPLPVSGIVEKCGFISTAYFYPLFKKYNGVTPNDYRKNRLHSN